MIPCVVQQGGSTVTQERSRAYDTPHGAAPSPMPACAGKEQSPAMLGEVCAHWPLTPTHSILT